MQRGFPWAVPLMGLACAGTVGAAVGLGLGHAPPGWLPAACAAALLVAVGAGVFVRGAGLFARPILGVEPARAGERLALTFDDGPDETETREVMDLLEAHGHRATFFVIGRRGAQARPLLEEIVRRGHALGNHTFAHDRLSAMASVEALTADLERAGRLLAEVGSPSPWLRPVAGVLSPRVAEAARRAGLSLVSWTATARDGLRTTAPAAAHRLGRALRPGAILVLHDGVERGGRRPVAAAALRLLVEELAARRLRSVTLDELLDDEGRR